MTHHRLSRFAALAVALSAAGAKAQTPADAEDIDHLSQAAIQSAFQILRSEYIRNGELTFDELNRAALQGLLERLQQGAELVDRKDTQPAQTPTGVLAEMLTPEIAYLRPLSLGEKDVQGIESKLSDYRKKKVPHLILDLRTPMPAGDFIVAEQLLDLFIARGQLLFRLKQVNNDDAKLFLSNREPVWPDRLIVLVDEETNNLGETVAAVLRQNSQALLIGAQTVGASVRYDTVPLDERWMLRFARAEVVLPDGSSLFKKGLKPDFPVVLPAMQKRQIFDVPEGISSVKELVFDQSRPRYNEAALVARKNPELELFIRRSQSNYTEDDASPPKDTVLQRAVDMLNAQEQFAEFHMDWPAEGKAGKTTVRRAAKATEP